MATMTKPLNIPWVRIEGIPVTVMTVGSRLQTTDFTRTIEGNQGLRSLVAGIGFEWLWVPVGIPLAFLRAASAKRSSWAVKWYTAIRAIATVFLPPAFLAGVLPMLPHKEMIAQGDG